MEMITKEDLRQFRMLLLNDFEFFFTKKLSKQAADNQPLEDWLKSKAVRKLMNMSGASLQNLRITGKVRFKKIMGSYYYNKKDLEKLFENETL